MALTSFCADFVFICGLTSFLKKAVIFQPISPLVFLKIVITFSQKLLSKTVNGIDNQQIFQSFSYVVNSPMPAALLFGSKHGGWQFPIM